MGAAVSGVTAAPLRKQAVRAVLSRASRRPAAAVASRRGLQAQGLRPPRAPRGRRGVRGCGQGAAGGGRRQREDAGGGLTPRPRSRPAPRGGVDAAALAERRGVGAGCGGTRLPASAYCGSLVRTQPFSTCTTSREFQPALMLASQRVNAVQLLPFSWAVRPPKLLANTGFHGHPSPAVPNSPAAKAQTPFPFLWMSVASASCILHPAPAHQRRSAASCYATTFSIAQSLGILFTYIVTSSCLASRSLFLVFFKVTLLLLLFSQRAPLPAPLIVTSWESWKTWQA